MSTIQINDLQTAGFDLFNDSESYMNSLTESELTTTHGGSSPFCAGVIVGLIITYKLK